MCQHGISAADGKVDACGREEALIEAEIGNAISLVRNRTSPSSNLTFSEPHPYPTWLVLWPNVELGARKGNNLDLNQAKDVMPPRQVVHRQHNRHQHHCGNLDRPRYSV
jgi:hypothetical protein